MIAGPAQLSPLLFPRPMGACSLSITLAYQTGISSGFPATLVPHQVHALILPQVSSFRLWLELFSTPELRGSRTNAVTVHLHV